MIDIVKILLWIAIILFIFTVSWYVLGSSPTLDTIMFIFTFIFLIFNIRTEINMKRNQKDTKFIKEKLSRLDDIYNILRERLK